MASDLLELSVELAKAHLSQNQMPHEDVPEFIRSIHNTLVELRDVKHSVGRSGNSEIAAREIGGEAASVGKKSSDLETAAAKVAVIRNESIDDAAFEGLDPWLAQRISVNLAKKLNRKSAIHPTVFDDRLICLEDGSEVKLLRPYVRKNFSLEFHEYLDKWNLPDNYPTAPAAYVENKRRLAKQSGLGVTTRARREKRREKSNVAMTEA